MSLFGAPSYSPVGGEYCHTDNTEFTDKAAELRVKSNVLPTEDGGAAVQGSKFKEKQAAGEKTAHRFSECSKFVVSKKKI